MTEGESALDFLARVEAKAKELYAASRQGPWDELAEPLQRMWIDAAGDELRKEES